MKLRLGMHLDGQHGRAPANQTGVADVGPLGLLGILESQLGLVPPMVSTAQRCVQFRECLHQLNGPDRFFHKSYEADDFGTAATLLSWRDEWRIHGWSGDIAKEGSSRLHDMVAIEKLAQDLLSPGTAERLQAISDAMAGRRLLIASISLVDPLEVFPALWQRVLTKLPIQNPQAPAALGRGLLGKLQHAIIEAGTKGAKTPIDWHDDASLYVVRGETTLLSGRWIAEALRQSGPDTLYVATSEAATADAFLAAADYPRQGLSESSAFRPALQLLPLLLELLWQPLNFNALIQFLTHPICPLSGKVRRRLAGVQSQYPGIGGPRWREAIAQIEEDAGARAAHVRQTIEFWIEHPRFDPLVGVPVATVLERTQRLVDFFRNSPSDASPALRLAYATGYNQCLSFAENLTRLLDQGVETLRPRQLEQLATQATARGNDNPLRIAEVGALPCVTHPGGVIEAHAVVLWGPLDAPSLPSPWPWSKAEIAALRTAGCALPDPEALLQQVAADWLRPILAATDKLILMLPPSDRESHPVWQMLNALIPKLPIYPVESMLREGTAPMTAINHTPLPGIKRWWQLPEGTVVPPVPEYSFSQLEKQVFNPFHWLLANAAKFRSGSLLSLVDDFRLKGLLAHSLVERLYRDADGLTMSDDRFSTWFDPAFDQLIAEEGAVYLMPGRRTDRDNLRQALRRALLELRGLLRAANVAVVEPERKLSGHFAGGSLAGYSDLVLMKPDKSQAIIDMKWAGKSHRSKLEENRHLQLAIYSELLRQSTGQWPALAYFLFSQGKLLTRDDLWFPGTHPVSNRSGENTAQLWQRFLVTWKWRQEQFAKGRFEVVLDDSDEPDSTPPDDGLPIEVLNLAYNECLHLAGWGGASMKAKLTFISAGAGSGKTHRLTSILHTELAAKRVKPSGVIATTFTRKAATELRERVRGFLLEQGEYTLANAMGQARIGTVNAVCGELLRRFAFEAGLPTEQTVLEEEQATLLLRQAIDMVQDSAEAAELGVLRERLSIEDWDDDFRNLVATIRANDIAPADLAKIAQENADDLLSHFPAPSKDKLTDDLIAALDKAIPLIQAGAGSVKVTAAYLETAETLRRGLRYGDARWSDWIKISKLAPATALKELALPVQTITERTVAHPDLHSDLRAYLARQFDLAARVLEVYTQIKLERGVIDFTDQERLLLKLMDDPFVAETMRDELDLLMVDEFQDTSPIQLALFLRLTQFAKQVYWVGDIKQAIYGFRGSDTELMEAILHELEALGGTKDKLDHSWRSRRPLVDLVNAAFVPAFSATMKAEDVALTAKRSEPMDGAPFATWQLPGNANEQVIALGQALRQVVDSGYIVYDKPAKRLRPVTLGDIAILRRSNKSVTATALGLRAAGVPAMTAQPGLLATPEAVLALACLRRLNDPGDTLASAEIISLAECSEPEVWVSDRLAYLAAGGDGPRWRETGDQPHSILSRLARLREDMPVMAPAEALETAIAECQLPGVVLRWNGSADIGRVRLANLDAIIAMARQYETVCAGAKHAASVSGLLLWLNEQASGEVDSLALPAIDAVQVMTHHKAKGLEWPIVVMMDIQGDVKDGLWNSLRAGSRRPITAADPLRERTLRLWPWPFGKQQKLPFKDELARTPIAQQFQKIAVEEAKRVLYVSMTRARDLIIFALPAKAPTGPWMETLEAPWLTTPDKENRITLPSGETIPLLPFPEPPAEERTETHEQLWWFRDPTTRQERPPRIFNPSKADSPAMAVAETISLGERMTIGSAVDWTTVGHAVHAAMALAFVDLSRPVAVEDVQRILNGYQVSAHVSASALTAQVIAVTQWVSKQWPGCRTLPEWPVEAILTIGQVLNGRIDLLVDTGSHWVLIDHKSNPGARSAWPELANTHGGQLLAYKAALEMATGKPVKEIWLVLPVAGGAIRIEKAATA